MQRYFLEEDLAINSQFDLPTDIAHHFMTVLRAKVGSKAEFVLADRKHVAIAEVVSTDADVTKMVVLELMAPEVELPVDVTMIIGLTKGDKPELVAQKTTELGVNHLIFVETAWSVTHWGSKASKKVARLLKIAEAAAEQSHRLITPTISYLSNLQALDLPADTQKIVAWEESAKVGEAMHLARTLAELKAGEKIAFLVGPEGGLKESELAYLETVGFKAAGLGPRILRAETAPLYLLSALSYALELER
ncbi:16S rRNA methyltransferase RsmE [Weissella oryzae SG25]|uniref:Ribosomal RNA small subunit methyltransferase E n=1 Tax=Weissella oryzae (strain DSM 25784 / JCM 18191 / LMG 30913 / SG25) TaxID=1329250 RepID=A0A069CT94_WEIOS|nr:16S rRNA (uracil(1498)-N(3))-methyltransferase [Weissella oryzae]GAK30627.1 16S rRNA methyltransferase RsmE [Weissella oryzae SG25]